MKRLGNGTKKKMTQLVGVLTISTLECPIYRKWILGKCGTTDIRYWLRLLIT